MNRAIATLFMLISVDGKISTGSSDDMDVDKDFPFIDGVKEGLHQYYEIEQTTDHWSLNSGRVQAKIGANEKAFPEKQMNISFVSIDNHHLTEHGVTYFTKLSKAFVIITTNRNHPAYQVHADNLHILYYEKISAKTILEDLYKQFSCERITVQTGGTLNGLFLREKVFDHIDIVMAPILIGGKDTPTLVDGESLTLTDDLHKLGTLSLTKVDPLENSYIRLQYKVVK